MSVPDLQRLRRSIHHEPEVGLHLPNTQRLILDALSDLDLDIEVGAALSSISAVLRGGNIAAGAGRPSVLLRADMDALPLVEKSGEPFSADNGAMHACGHDMHSAALVGAAHLLSENQHELAGDVVFMFQPGEEGGDGAQLMLDEGILERTGSRPVAAYGLHMAPDSPAGTFLSRPGSYMAAFTKFDVVVTGAGGHGSRPYQALDPIVVAAEMVTSLQVFVTRRFNVFDPVIATVGEFHAGSAPNVIPDHARFSAVVRSFSPNVLESVNDDVPQLFQNIARAHGLTAEVTRALELPPVVNDVASAAHWRHTATSLFGESRFEELENPRTGSEDFAKILAQVPGAFGHVGAGAPETNGSNWAPLHSPEARFDDRILPDVSRFLASLADTRLRDEVPQSGSGPAREMGRELVDLD
ncbi:amidohydrolase [Rhodococcus sp. 05-2255-3B1]|uniref:M20 metallopeptidase family protein n=1 Tax=unclassified Rhodococcus (in: high G+C Gram-positive bacteria) TaxID=192944 RepID=UPI000B9AE1A6|nr:MULTISPECIES: M20 family metallopeptidase [unclassified Rhodococcus (in: high G+C Gram-positive bacteria)]OZE03328.1 amidohydrolase [Rhodococcus sp. 05-2255-3C]OZE09715.1 amidohydrolase [Rhodococcus sp. 05-2255-3B1]OZE14982.1 amidohydrolase [Rhodococcus sp. 05-2255-2A2]